MKLTSTCGLAILLIATASAQSAPAREPSNLATIQGVVVKDPDGQPVKKTLIELIAENQSEGGDYTATTGPDGSFRIENILPGRYHLFAERNGFLDVEKQRGRSEGRILTLAFGQEAKDLIIRLQSAAVVRGRVTDEDGDPLPNAEVTVFRRTYAGGHKHWEQAGSERTNDQGEYRIANLSAGSVYLSVVPPPDFKSLIESGATNQSHPAPDKPAAMSYQTTYYPGTNDRSQAAPIPLHPGDDYPIDFSLAPSASLSIRGRLVNVPPQASATIMLQSQDFNLMLSGAEMQRDGSFVIRDVSPGKYTILATVDGAPVPMTARQSLQVGSSNVDGLRLAPQPGAKIRGRLRLEGKTGHFDPAQIFLALRSMESDDDTTGLFPNAAAAGFADDAHVSADGSFEWTNVPAGTYAVQFSENGGGSELLVKSMASGGRDISDSGVSVNGGLVGLDLVATTDGGVIDGLAVDSRGNPIADAIVVAIPDASRRTRTDHFRKTLSDQNGHFRLPGLGLGEYTVLAWESLDGEPYYDREFLKSYQERGTLLSIREGERKGLQVEAIPEIQEEQ